MPVVSNLHRPVSRRGRWRGSYLIVMDGGPGDAEDAVFRIAVRSKDRGCSRRDYGHWLRDRSIALRAQTDDQTNQFVVVPTAAGLACSWLFPANSMRDLCAGSYEASISAAIGDEDAELALLNFVVR